MPAGILSILLIDFFDESKNAVNHYFAYYCQIILANCSLLKIEKRLLRLFFDLTAYRFGRLRQPVNVGPLL